MTLVQRYLVDIQDIRAIRLTCRECHTTTSVVLDHAERLPTTCPQCSIGWFPPGTSDRHGLLQFVQGLTMLAKRGADAAGHLQLEIPLG